MKKGRPIKYMVMFLIAAVVVAAAGLAWLYTGKPSLAKQNVLSALPLPIAMVGNKPLLMKDYLARYDAIVSNKVEGSNAGTLKKNLLNTLLLEKKTSLVAQKHGVSVGTAELNDEYARVVKNTDLQGKGNFEDYLGSFGLSEQAFKQVFLKPQLLDAKLMVWFNNQKDLNREPFMQAQRLMDQLNASTTMESLAKQYSQDLSSKSLEGDMGFVLVNDLLPELQEQIDALAKGQVKMLVSRYGIHLAKLEDKDNQGPQNAARVHLRQIFIPENDYQKWLATEASAFPAKILYNPAN